MNSGGSDGESCGDGSEDDERIDPRHVPNDSQSNESEGSSHAGRLPADISVPSTPHSMFDFDELEATVEGDPSQHTARSLDYDDPVNDPDFKEISYAEEDANRAEKLRCMARDAKAAGLMAEVIRPGRSVKRQVEEIESQRGSGNTERDLLTLPAEVDKDGYTTIKGKRQAPLRSRQIGGRRLRMARGITVDSGAADNVMPRKVIRKNMKVRSSQASRSGVHYVAANDHRIANEGEVDFAFETKDGQAHSWTFQVAEVNKVLASVSALVDSNHRVTFEKDEKTGIDMSFIVNKTTGRTIKMRRERNVWTIDAFVNDDSGFIRPE